VSCVQLLLVVGRTELQIEEVGRGRRKLSNVEFDGLCVGKNNEILEIEMDGILTFMGVKRKMGNRGIPPLIFNLGTKWRCVVNFTRRSIYTQNNHRYRLNWRLVWFQMLSAR